MRGYSSVARHRLLLVTSMLCSLLLLGVLAGCVAVSGGAPAADGALQTVRADINALDMRVAALETRLPAPTATVTPALTVTPTSDIESATWDSGGIALSHAGTMTSSLALLHVTRVISPQRSIDLDLWRTDSEVRQAIANATLQLALIEAESAPGFYDLYVPESISLARPAAWHFYSRGVLTDTTVMFLQPGQPISQVVPVDLPANIDLADGIAALELARGNLSRARRAQILLQVESSAATETILIPIDQDGPSGGDRIKAWCSTSCKFRWCRWFCRLIK